MTARAADALAAINPKDLVEGLGKGLRVIEAFDDDHPRLTASDAGVGLAPRVLRLGQSYLAAARLPRLVQPCLQRAAGQIGHTVNASVLDGHKLVYTARSSPPRRVTIGNGVGVRIPAHSSSDSTRGSAASRCR